MTDRLNGFIVTLEKDIRDDDAQAIINAISMIKGVLDVSPLVVNHEDHIADMRARKELTDKLFALIKEIN